jgi:hypothetical protein
VIPTTLVHCKIFALEPIGSLTNHHQLFRNVCLFFPAPFPLIQDLMPCQHFSSSYSRALNIPSSYSYHNTTPSPCPSFRLPSVAPVSSSKFSSDSSELETEVDVILTLLTKLIGGKAGAGEARPRWIGLLAVETLRG